MTFQGTSIFVMFTTKEIIDLSNKCLDKLLFNEI